MGILGREEDTLVVNAAKYAALRAERDELKVRLNTALVILDERVDLGDEEGWPEIAEQWLNDIEKALRGKR